MPEARATRPGSSGGHALAFALAMILSAVATRSLALLGAIGLAGVIALYRGRVPARRVVARLRGTALVVGGAVAIGAFLSPDHALRNAASLAARVLDAALWATWLVATHSPRELDEALRALGVPRAVVALVALTRRFGAQLRSTMRAAWNATALRGGFGAPRRIASSVGTIAGLLVVRALDRTDRAKLALDLRGGDEALFAGEQRLSWSSWFALAAVLGALSLADRTWGAP